MSSLVFVVCVAHGCPLGRPEIPGALVGVVSPLLWALLRASRRCERVRSRRTRNFAASLSACVDLVLRNSHKYGYALVAFRASSWFASTRDTVRSFTWRLLSGCVQAVPCVFVWHPDWSPC